MDELSKYKPELIDKYINEFREMLGNKAGRNQRRFIARGAYLSAIRDSLDERLKTGWGYLQLNPDASDAAEFWFKLLDRYESICDLLFKSKDDVTLEQAAASIFDGVEYDGERGSIHVRVAGRPEGKPADTGSSPAPVPR